LTKKPCGARNLPIDLVPQPFLEDAMVLGTGLFALLLLGAPQEPPIVPPSGGPGSDFIVFMEPVLGDWDWDGGRKYAQCRGPYPKYPSLPNGKQNVLYYAGGEWNTAKFDNLNEANNWISRNCATCSL
jgi:hypothetical protein